MYYLKTSLFIGHVITGLVFDVFFQFCVVLMHYNIAIAL